MSDAVATRERPILFSGPMVRAILDRRKTQTRRVILRRLKDEGEWCTARPDRGFTPETIAAQYPCPYGAAGDRLWVRETWLPDPPINGWSGDVEWVGSGQQIDGVPPQYRSPRHCLYAATWEGPPFRWRPSIHMPRWASRLTLDLTDVRVERVQDISESDAEAEGLTKRGHWWDVGTDWKGDGLDTTASGAFRMRWDALNAKRGYGWDANPFVWCLTFKVVE